jgi:hypothetical protein
MSSQIQIVDEYPLPFDREEIVDMQVEQVGEPYGLRSYSEVITSIDEFHERYIEELKRTDEWVFFRDRWGDYGNIYVWNHQSGYGFKFEAGWETACGLIEAWDQFTDEYDSSDFEPTNYIWEVP